MPSHLGVTQGFNSVSSVKKIWSIGSSSSSFASEKSDKSPPSTIAFNIWHNKEQRG